MIDKTTRILLMLIAGALWANYAQSVFAPQPARAEKDLLGSLVKNYAGAAGSDFNVIKKAILSIADGTCGVWRCGPRWRGRRGRQACTG